LTGIAAMQHIHAARARLPGGWARDVRVGLDAGRIAAVLPGRPPEPGDIRVDVLLPALVNLHSHAFQRAMAGRTERRARAGESFWTWRTAMYACVGRLTPGLVADIAAMAFCEMLEGGFAAVAEFHYVHHQRGGTPYDNVAEMSESILSAAAETGIGLTLLPVFYRWGGLGRRPLEGGQRRFGTSPDGYARLLSAVRDAARRAAPDTAIGIAPHSLRAVAPEDLAAILPLAEDGPVHIHVAEQVREVEEVQAQLGARPVDWLLDHAPVGPAWCAVHATHMTPAETARLAATGAVAGLCPITEANLGDGLFDGPGWLAAGGAFGVGSDSNVSIDPAGELRLLEYGQRLRDRARAVMAPADGAHTGAALWRAAAEGGARALGRACGAIALGLWADLVAVDGGDPGLAGLDGDALLDGLVFAAGRAAVREVWAAGRHVVQGGRHIARERICARFARAQAALWADADG
jgi:formiminoglutamate deiminase